jgi:hypothetical protein
VERAAVLVLTVLAGCAGGHARDPAPLPPRPDLQAPAARLDLTRIERAIRLYAEDRAGRLPSSLEALSRESAPGDPRPYLASLPRDPWERPYSYAVLSSRLGTYDLRSYGPDALPGTGDDVVGRAEAVPIR